MGMINRQHDEGFWKFRRIADTYRSEFITLRGKGWECPKGNCTPNGHPTWDRTIRREIDGGGVGYGTYHGCGSPDGFQNEDEEDE